jgi:hypothetical protein
MYESVREKEEFDRLNSSSHKNREREKMERNARKKSFFREMKPWQKI